MEGIKPTKEKSKNELVSFWQIKLHLFYLSMAAMIIGMMMYVQPIRAQENHVPGKTIFIIGGEYDYHPYSFIDEERSANTCYPLYRVQ
jgi:hypothetical protein